MCRCMNQGPLGNIEPHLGENIVSFSKIPCTCDKGRLTDGRQCPICKGSGEVDKNNDPKEEKIELHESTKK